MTIVFLSPSHLIDVKRKFKDSLICNQDNCFSSLFSNNELISHTHYIYSITKIPTQEAKK